MARMGHNSARAALIYQHPSRDRDRAIAAAVSARIEAARRTESSRAVVVEAKARCGWCQKEAEMIVYDIGPSAVAGFERVELATATDEPASPIGYFVFHGCVCGVASFAGRPPWELHSAGDEMLHILDGSCELTIRQATGDARRLLGAGDVVIVPQGCWHSNDAPDGVTMFFMTPKDGNEHSWDEPAM